MSSAERKIILSGSFNPLHDGHLKLLEVAARYINNNLVALLLKCLITLELSHRPVTFWTFTFQKVAYLASGK